MQGPRSRRELLAEGMLATGALVAAKHRVPKRSPGAPRDLIGDGAFSSGVSSGAPGYHGAPLWTRVEGIEKRGKVWLEVARSPDFRHVVGRRAVTVDPRRDCTVQHNFNTKRVKPGEQLWYRFATKNSHSPVGRIRTRRPPDSAEPVRVAFFSCQAFQSGYYTAHRGLAEEDDIDLVCGIGDYVYEKAGDTGGPREDKSPPAQLLEEYRAKYRLYQGDRDLQAMHAAHPFIAIWDDHEVESSYYDLSEGNRQGATPRVPFAQRRANGYRAFFEHLPITRFKSDPDRIYRRIRLGRNAEVFLTDLHQYAPSHEPDCSGTPSAGPILLGPCPDAVAPGRQLLGETQRRWLADGLVTSGATWKLWGTSMMLMALDLLPQQTLTVGEWGGWEWERNTLAAELHARGVRNMAAFSGDIHTYFAGNWTTTGRTGSPVVAPEFVAGSISSFTIAENFAASGVPEDAAALLVERLPLLNPHLSYVDSRRHGYAVATAERGRLTVELRSPTTTRQPRARMETIAKFTVEEGDPRPVRELV